MVRTWGTDLDIVAQLSYSYWMWLIFLTWILRKELGFHISDRPDFLDYINVCLLLQDSRSQYRKIKLVKSLILIDFVTHDR